MIDDSPTFSLTLLCFASWLLMQKCATLSKSPNSKQMAEPLAKGPPEENTRSHVKPSIWKAFSNASLRPLHSPIMPVHCAQQCSAPTHVHPLALNLARCSRALPCLCNGSRCGATRPVSSNLMHIGRGRCSNQVWKQCMNYSDWGKPPKKCFYLGKSPKCGWVWCYGPRLL